MTASYGLKYSTDLPPDQHCDVNRTSSYRPVYARGTIPENASRWTLRSDRGNDGLVEIPAHIPAPQLCSPPVQHMPAAMPLPSRPGESFPARVKTDASELTPDRQTDSLYQRGTPKCSAAFRQRSFVSTTGLCDARMESKVSGGGQYPREGWEVLSDAPFAQQTSLPSAREQFFSDNINGKSLLEIMEGNGWDVFGRSLREPLEQFSQPTHPPNGFPPSIPMYVSGFSGDLNSPNTDEYEARVRW